MSGFGPIAKCDFIVENEIDGVRLSENVIPIHIKLMAAEGMDKFGNAFSMPQAQTTIYLDMRENTEAPKVEELILFPNPAGDYLELHLNGNNTISSFNVYTSTGVLMDHRKLSGQSNHERINLDKYLTGLYIIEIYTPKGKTAQRFEVIK